MARPYRKGEVREDCKRRMLEAIRTLKAERTYPSARAIRLLLPDLYDDLILDLRRELVRERAVDIGLGRWAVWARRDASARDVIKSRVLEAADSLKSEGAYPSVPAVMARVTGYKYRLIYDLRRELIEDGELVIRLRGRRGRRDGLLGATKAEQSRIEGARLAVLAEKIAAGEEPYQPREDRR